MKPEDLRSIGFLNHVDGIQIVAVTNDLETLRVVVPYDTFQKVRGNNTKTKELFCTEYNKSS